MLAGVYEGPVFQAPAFLLSHTCDIKATPPSPAHTSPQRAKQLASYPNTKTHQTALSELLWVVQPKKKPQPKPGQVEGKGN